ncbi:MAG TPA: alginate O-acetyltransferase, partial [Planctomycetes bacterium]|nr:alginate O-acetyltransferase [Planctomycetota bacterium]
MVLADSLALSIDEAFQLDPATFSAADVWFTTILFGFQIYFDFSGYSDMAIGSARLLGLRFPDNFNYPYLARSPKEFWGRWHISLSSWIRDYLYLPLTGQKFRTQSTEGLGEAASDQARNAALL